SVVVQARLPCIRRPRLIWKTTFQGPADVDELLADFHVGASAGRARSVVFDVPDAGEIGFAIGGSRRRRGEIGPSAAGLRNAGRRGFQPLRGEGSRHRSAPDGDA